MSTEGLLSGRNGIGPITYLMHPSINAVLQEVKGYTP
jgi:hypothetical protein